MKNNTIEYYHYNNIPINWDNLTIENRDKLINDIVNKKSYARVISLNKKDTLDLFTAQHIKQIKDNLGDEHKNKFLGCSLYKTVALTWRLIEKCRGG